MALLVVCSFTATAFGATHKPVVTSFSPAQVPVGGTLVLKGKYFLSGASHNRVFFSRASDGKTVRARPKSASKTRITVVVPAALTQFLASDGKGGKAATRFQISVLSKTFGPKTSKSRSPIVLPAGATPTTPGTTTPGTATPGTTPPPPPDCDGDGTPDAQDNDDDNDGLPDTVEAAIGTNPCNKDTDGDGVEDGYEYYSALDLNGNNLPYPGKRPYPNPLDNTDANKDFDGDGMTQLEEFRAWNLYGGRVLPSAPGQSFPYSDGNQTSPAANGPGAMDLDNNGRITDEEKDADSDGLPNWIELPDNQTVAFSASSGCAFVPSTGPAPNHYANIFAQCNGGPIVPTSNTFFNVMLAGTTVNGTNVPDWLSTQRLDYLNPDSDGDGLNDGNDDNDFDGLSNLEEITAGTDGFYTAPQDPCDPNVNARSCPLHKIG